MKHSIPAFILTAALSIGSAPAFGFDVVDTMSRSTSFKTFSAALRSSGLADTLKNPGPFTVFAPSDQAIAKLPKGTWETLTKDKARLTDILAHHVVPGKIVSAEAKPGEIPTLDGKPLRLESDNGMISVGDAKVTQSDILADNGVIHEIDTLVLPGEE
ncbi:MAG TPA: fasciclin domain-containing protein [Paucimonas sp.]|nr:fasciclin domain-containing protein [Paucimonas sp.]